MTVLTCAAPPGRLKQLCPIIVSRRYPHYLPGYIALSSPRATVLHTWLARKTLRWSYPKPSSKGDVCSSRHETAVST